MMNPEQVKRWRCPDCGKEHRKEVDANYCLFTHYRGRVANGLWKEGYPLSHIKYMCGFHWKLSAVQRNVTKDSCFIVSHWQLCKKPAYQIERITGGGGLYLGGIGGWMGHYGQNVGLDRIKNPHPKEDLFVYGEEAN